MKPKSILFSLIVATFLHLISFSLVFADIIPPPTFYLNFYVTLNNKPVPDSTFYAVLLTCQKEGNRSLEGKDASLFPQLNINIYDPSKNCYWRPSFLDPIRGGYYKITDDHYSSKIVRCDHGVCEISSYYRKSKLKLAIYLPSQNKVYLSSEFGVNFGNNFFKANLTSKNGISLKESQSLASIVKISFLLLFVLFSLIVTLVLEIVAALIYLRLKRISKRVLLSVVGANIISVPIFGYLVFFFVAWVLSLLFRSIFIGGDFMNAISWIFAFIIVEIVIIIFEKYFICLLNKKYITPKQSFWLSLFINLSSGIIGLFFFFILGIWGGEFFGKFVNVIIPSLFWWIHL